MMLQRRRLPHLALWVALVLVGCSTAPEDVEEAAPTLHLSGPIAPGSLGSTRHVHAIEGFLLAGQPAPEDFALARERGVRTVLTLRHPREIDFDEERVVEELGLEYVALSFAGPGELDDSVFDRGRTLLSTLERPVLFHCASANRVGALWLPWRVLEGGLSFDAALAEARTIGLRTACARPPTRRAPASTSKLTRNRRGPSGPGAPPATPRV